MERPTTPPPKTVVPTGIHRTPPTPEITRRIEENRLKAKAIRDQREAGERQRGETSTIARTASGFTNTTDISITGRKRSHASISAAQVPETQRDARNAGASVPKLAGNAMFTKYVEYDFSKMTDTKGGFLTAEDDPHNKVLHAPQDGADAKPEHMSLKEWERHRLLKSLRNRKDGPFEPGLSVLDKEKKNKCKECRSLEIDWQWEEVFGCAICTRCKEKFPEKYSLLTKTEVKDDYLITEPELKDPELLPHLNKPNPHKSHWHDMMLFLRYQVEEYAFNTKWGSAEALDAEFERREANKKKQKEDKFKSKLLELKKKTRTENYRKAMRTGAKGGTFGDSIGGGRHEHEWGRTVEKPDGTSVKSCVECGMEVEELEF